MNPPNKIIVPSSDEELLFKEEDKRNKLLKYEYVKSLVKVGMILPITIELVEENLRKGIFKIIE